MSAELDASPGAGVAVEATVMDGAAVTVLFDAALSGGGGDCGGAGGASANLMSRTSST
jgi:hypothetical protein